MAHLEKINLFRLVAKTLCYGAGVASCILLTMKASSNGNTLLTTGIVITSLLSATAITLEEIKSFLEKKTLPHKPKNDCPPKEGTKLTDYRHA